MSIFKVQLGQLETVHNGAPSQTVLDSEATDKTDQNQL